MSIAVAFLPKWTLNTNCRVNTVRPNPADSDYAQPEDHQPACRLQCGRQNARLSAEKCAICIAPRCDIYEADLAEFRWASEPVRSR